MAELAAAPKIEETHAEDSLKNHSEFTERPPRKTAEVHRGRSSKRPVENIEETLRSIMSQIQAETMSITQKPVNSLHHIPTI